jgi:putative nucleotidyltransferase with HDIG domain
MTATNPSPSHVSEEQLAQRLRQLPLLPAVVTEMLSLDAEADDYLDRLVRLAECDPPFAVRVLQCANSAYSAPWTPIVSLDKAAMRLGTDQCAGLVLALSVIKVFIPRTEAQRFLWVHSLQTALFASRFCKDVPALRRQCSQAYVCGLLHDIGRFVQFEGAPADLTRVDEMHWMGPEELVDRERSTLGYDHALLGWHACRKWSLPDPIGEVVRHHHADLSHAIHEHADLIRLVQWADALSMALLLDPGIADMTADSLMEHLACEHAAIGPGHSPDEKARWHRWVPDLRDKSMQLAREMNLLR